MKIYKPDYYDKFICIASDCGFTCCKEWKIAVDDATNSRWKDIKPPAGMKTRRKNLSLFTKFKDGSRVIELNHENTCPFLDEAGLCRLVSEYGEECLSETCHVFPRETHEYADRKELTLMPACPVVVDLLNGAESFRVICVEEDTLGEKDTVAEEAAEEKACPARPDEADIPNIPEEQLRALRDLLMETMSNPNYTPALNLKAVFFIAKSVLEKGAYDEEAIRRDIPELRNMLMKLRVNREDCQLEDNELFLDLVENYRKEGLYKSYLDEPARIAESTAEKSEYGLTKDLMAKLVKYVKEWVTYSKLNRNLLTQEIYADCLLPGRNIRDMVVRIQWITMQFVLARQLGFLKYRELGELTYETVRNCHVLAERIMGYEEEDIYEYLENCFEDMVWDFGYLDLILG